jgi:hypothetical protein
MWKDIYVEFKYQEDGLPYAAEHSFCIPSWTFSESETESSFRTETVDETIIRQICQTMWLQQQKCQQ